MAIKGRRILHPRKVLVVSSFVSVAYASICGLYVLQLSESPRKKKSDTANSSKDKVEEDDENEDGEDEDQLDDDDEQDEGEDSDEQDAEENDEENGEESEDAERGLSATEKEVVRRAIQRTVTIVNADHNVTYRVTRRSARLNAGK